MKRNFRMDFEKLLGLLSSGERKKYDYRLERQAFRITRSIDRLEEASAELATPKARDFRRSVGEYSLLK